MIPSDYNARRYELWAGRHTRLDGLLRLAAWCVWLLLHPVSLIVVGLALMLGVTIGCPVQFTPAFGWRALVGVMGLALIICSALVGAIREATLPPYRIEPDAKELMRREAAAAEIARTKGDALGEQIHRRNVASLQK